MPEKLTHGSFVIDNNKRVCSLHSFQSQVYIGTAPDGVALKTIDGFSVEEFWRIEDRQITAMANYGGALFFGTSPNGQIYMHNFNTSNRFLSVESGDYAITAFEVHNDKLYAGTSPSGLILSFDGKDWIKEQDVHGGTINELVSYNDGLYVFLEQSETIPFLDEDGLWKLLESDEKPFSISSFSHVNTDIIGLEQNKNFDHSFSAAGVFNGNLLFAGGTRAALYSYDGTTVTMSFQTDGDRINAIHPMDSSQVFLAIDDKLYVNEVEVTVEPL